MFRSMAFFILVSTSTCLLSQANLHFMVDSNNLRFIEQAWRINTSGDRVTSYYSIQINNRIFPGLRPFELRWNMIKDAVDYTDKNILELGCCTGLPSTLLKKYKNPSRVVAVDMSDQRLRAAQLFAEGFGVDIEFYKIHLGNNKYEDLIGYDFDIVFCMSLLHWVPNKDRFMRYLSHFKHVIFEGHRSPAAGIALFKKYGFTSYQILGLADRARTVILFSK